MATFVEARAEQKHLRRSPRKLRLVADLVRGMNVEKAISLLAFMPQAGAVDVSKVIKSAAANARDKFQEEAVENRDLVIKTIYVNEGTFLKRIQPAPQGRAHPIKKRASHITVVVARPETAKSEEV